MQRRVILVGLIMSLAAIAITGVFLSRQRREVPLQGTATLIYPKGTPQAMLWPHNESWVWSIHGLEPKSSGQSLSLVVRVMHQDLKPGVSQAVEIRTISKTQSESEITFGKIPGLKRDGEGMVSVQLIDLSKLDLAGGKKPLRLLLALKMDGMTTSRGGEQTVIEGETFTGQGLNPEPVWNEGELHLQTLFTRTGDRVTIYHVVLVQSE